MRTCHFEILKHHIFSSESEPLSAWQMWCGACWEAPFQGLQYLGPSVRGKGGVTWLHFQGVIFWLHFQQPWWILQRDGSFSCSFKRSIPARCIGLAWIYLRGQQLMNLHSATIIPYQWDISFSALFVVEIHVRCRYWWIVYILLTTVDKGTSIWSWAQATQQSQMINLPLGMVCVVKCHYSGRRRHHEMLWKDTTSKNPWLQQLHRSIFLHFARQRPGDASTEMT